MYFTGLQWNKLQKFVFFYPKSKPICNCVFSSIMDDNNAHIFGHTPIDPNQLAMLENLLQVWMLEMEKAVQQQ